MRPGSACRGLGVPLGGCAPVRTFPGEGGAEFSRDLVDREGFAAPFAHGAAEAYLAAARLVEVVHGNALPGLFAPGLAPGPQGEQYRGERFALVGEVVLVAAGSFAVGPAFEHAVGLQPLE